VRPLDGVKGVSVAADDDVKLDVLEEMVDGFNNHDLDAIMVLFTDDCIFESPRGPEPWGRRFEGRAAVREGLGSRFTTIPDVHYGNSRNFVSGDRGASEWTLTGTTVEGQKLAVRGCDLWTFRDDRIVVKDSYWKLVEP
jgi:ketosteroid isomerase-like protein